jgi:hypothetical protein
VAKHLSALRRSFNERTADPREPNWRRGSVPEAAAAGAGAARRASAKASPSKPESRLGWRKRECWKR